MTIVVLPIQNWSFLNVLDYTPKSVFRFIELKYKTCNDFAVQSTGVI